MKTLREIRAAAAAFEGGLKGLADALPVTAVSLVIWLVLVPVSVVRDVLRWMAGLLEAQKLWARWMRS